MECKNVVNSENKPLKSHTQITGLTDKQVRERVLRGQVNVIPKAPSRTLGQMIRANFFNIFNFINIVLALLVIIAGAPKNAVFALVIVVNSFIGVGQELNARKTLEKLSVLSMAHVNVIRNSEVKKIAIDELVKDDIVFLDAGQQILADCSLIESDELEIDESMLTGEADPIYKKKDDVLYSGSFVVAGEGYAKVTSVGTETYSSRLAEEARSFKIINSELQSSISKIIKLLLILIVPVGILLAVTQFKYAGSDWRESIIGSVSGIVGMIPEGLVLLASTTFIVSVVKLSKHHTLVQQLSATEVLARVDTLCVDKTGTITEGKLKLVDIVAVNNADKDKIDDVLAIMSNNLPSKNPTQLAISDYFKEYKDVKIIEKVPFSSRRKWGGIILEEYGAWVLGAPEILLQDRYEEYKEKIEIEAAKGRRVLLLGKVNQTTLKSEEIIDIEEAALILIEDIIKEGTPKVLEYFNEQGVNLKVISGDNPVTVSAVAKRAGVQGAEKYVDARTLPESYDELRNVVNDYNIYGRVTPHQKKDIVRALKDNGHTVAMTGDGVNDVLALKESDCGIAMANGSEATKAVAQLVLMNSDFTSLPEVVAEGRKQIFNLERVAELFLSKTAFFVLLAIVFCIVRVSYPMIPIQSSLVGSCTIGIPAFFLSMSPYKGRIQSNFLKRILRKSIPNGIIMSGLVIAGYLIAHFQGNNYRYCSSVAVLVFFGISLVVLVKVSRPISKFKIMLIISMIAAGLICFFIPLGRMVFSLAVLSKRDLIMSGLLVAASIPLIYVASKKDKKN